ncbi:MAG TPA: histidine--tRNA ligase [Ktedonobacterales bacterium]|nr:histidine--tRNA ligase [Ktedonobacterales bacterium]
MAKTSATPPRGTRDLLPRDLVVRNRVFDLLRATFERYGFEPLETPAVESTSALEGKYGAEGERLLFRVLKRGSDLEAAGRAVVALPEAERTGGALARQLADLALRYDLTVPFARVVAAHQAEIVLPFRRYQMQPVWRADRPQHGRYREFYQCDVDCVGSQSVVVEAEMLLMVTEIFSALGFTEFAIHINHRAVLEAVMEGTGVPAERRVAAMTAIDKHDKIGATGVRAELVEAGLEAATVERLMEVVGIAGTPAEVIAALRPIVGASTGGEAGLRELGQLFDDLNAMRVPAERYVFDMAMVRGLSYYTGIIFETIPSNLRIGTLASGGRYDRLIGMFLGRELPCTGISFGIDRMFDAMAELNLLEGDATTATQVLVALFGQETLADAYAVAAELRRNGIRTEVYPDANPLRAQLTFASKKGIPLVCIVGPDEAQRGEVTVRDLRSGQQQAVALGEVAGHVAVALG